MTYKEEHKDLFSVNFKEWIPAHCISSDCKMGAGIAVPMAKKFKLRGMINLDAAERKHPVALYYHKVYNLITKRLAWHKPTYQSLQSTLDQMRDHAVSNDIKKIVMPKIGCGIDGLSWPKVRMMVKDSLYDTDVEILVCCI